MRSCVSQAGGQFHDAHRGYNEAVEGMLNKMQVDLLTHHDSGCKYCEQQSGKPIDPPFRLKARLYLLSAYLRMKCRVSPKKWTFPWITSDRFKKELELHGMATR
jgi:hypothetical protein